MARVDKKDRLRFPVVPPPTWQAHELTSVPSRGIGTEAACPAEEWAELIIAQPGTRQPGMQRFPPRVNHERHGRALAAKLKNDSGTKTRRPHTGDKPALGGVRLAGLIAAKVELGDQPPARTRVVQATVRNLAVL